MLSRAELARLRRHAASLRLHLLHGHLMIGEPSVALEVVGLVAELMRELDLVACQPRG